MNDPFGDVQRKLAPLWRSLQASDEVPHTVVVVPSVSLDSVMVEQLSTVQPSEERFLILLMLLRQPQARLVYVTSEPIAPDIVDYYLHLMPGVIPAHALQDARRESRR